MDSITAPRSGLLQDITMAGRDLERRLEGSPASVIFPTSLLDFAEQANYGTRSLETTAMAALDVGAGGLLGKAGQKGYQLMKNLETLQVPDWLKNSVANMLRAGEDPDEIAKMWQFQRKEKMSASIPFEPVEETPMGLLPRLTDEAKSLGWVDDKLVGAATPSEKPVATFVTGLPAAGKSSIANPLARDINAAIVDPDEAKKLLPTYGYGEGAAAVHQQSKVLAQGMQDQLVADRYNILIPTVGESTEKLAAKAQALKDQGYAVNLVNMLVSPKEAKGRALMRSAKTGRHIPMRVLDDYGTKPLDNYGILKEMGVFDNYALIDNSGGKDVAKQVLEDTGGLFSLIPGFSS